MNKKVYIITCHDVYNAGASLQAYALQHYLRTSGVNAWIIDYKPPYLSGHYSLLKVNNPKYKRSLLGIAYLLAKFPSRLKALRSPRKRNFDVFRRKYLKLTRRYKGINQLIQDCPQGHCFIAGSDQIWNPFFPNGRDPAFFLQFVPEGVRRISYAASFGVESLEKGDAERMKTWLVTFDAISVREKTGVEILNGIGVSSVQICDPVFLLKREDWEHLSTEKEAEHEYVFLYDFDGNPEIQKIAKAFANQFKCSVYSVFSVPIADRVVSDFGPGEFISIIRRARLILTNSFHAIAFSLIFHKDFYSFSRQEPISSRMRDLMYDMGLADRYCETPEHFSNSEPIQWPVIDEIIKQQQAKASDYLRVNCISVI